MDTLEIVDLERILSDEPRCESTHGDLENLVCTETVTHRFRSSCNTVGNSCEAAARYVARSIEESGAICGDCGAPVAKCWKIIPI